MPGLATKAMSAKVRPDLSIPRERESQFSRYRSTPFSVLTNRQLEILQLIVNGKSDREIASDLGLSKNTVGVHRSNIKKSFGLRKTAQIVVHAIREGLVEVDI